MNSSDLFCTEGIILHMVPYQNYDQILTIFTLHQGVIKLFCKKGKVQWQRYTPLMKVEVTYREKKSELFACEEIALLQSYLNLRNHLIHLQTGCELIKTIYSSQVIGKEASLLYQLLAYYLDKIPDVRDPLALVASFKLKMLQHEGLLRIDRYMQQYYKLGDEELDLLMVLAYNQSYRLLADLTLPPNFKDKVDRIFLKNIRH